MAVHQPIAPRDLDRPYVRLSATMTRSVPPRTRVVAKVRRRTCIGSHLLAAVESLAADEDCHAIVADAALDGPAELFLRNRGWTGVASPQLRRTLA